MAGFGLACSGMFRQGSRDWFWLGSSGYGLAGEASSGAVRRVWVRPVWARQARRCSVRQGMVLLGRAGGVRRSWSRLVTVRYGRRG